MQLESKKLKLPFIIKFLLQIILFISGIVATIGLCFFLYGYEKTHYSSNYYDSEQYERLFSKYVERTAAYINLKERGFDSAESSDTTLQEFSAFPITGTEGEPEYDYNYYNQLLNYQPTNFIYYVKNLTTGQYYYSPTVFTGAESEIQKQLEKFTNDITNKTYPVYFILNTKTQRYSTNYMSNLNYYDYFAQDDLNWIINQLQNTIDTSISSEKEGEKKFEDSLNIKKKDAKEKTELNQYIMYACIKHAPAPLTEDGFFSIYKEFTTARNLFYTGIKLAIVAGILFFICFILSICACGYKRTEKTNQIILNKFDKMPTELFGISGIIFFALMGSAYLEYTNFYLFEPSENIIINLIYACCLFWILLYPVCALFFYSFIRRIKSHTFWNNFFLLYIIRRCKQAVKTYFYHRTITFKVTFILCSYLAVNVFLILLSATGLFPLNLLVIFALFITLSYTIIKIAVNLSMIELGAKRMSEGEITYQIPEIRLLPFLRPLAQYINNISNGLSAAVEEQLKSERMKTELITNVSHDIKTPLTSIINYVDLLQKEELHNSTAKEYLNVLKNKSWRLKTLIEDLVEASKASTGNISLTIEQLNLVELVRQSIGEFEDRFQEHQLDVILSVQQDPIYIIADGRNTFRIIENLLSNVNKYAMPNTRVYIDVTTKELIATVSIKNISESQLNITSEELTERFVRGDSSRNTEGYGLGLSIAKSLTTLQHGTLEIILDGDLFKVLITFPISENQSLTEQKNLNSVS